MPDNKPPQGGGTAASAPSLPRAARVAIGCGLTLLFLLVSALSLALGTRAIPLGDVASFMLGQADPESFTARVLMQRVPRTLFSLLAGAALGVSGLLMQSVTRNPIADPSILGVNSGAALAVVCGIAFAHITTTGQYMAFAMAGGAVTALLVYGVGSAGSGGATPLKLALSGTAVSVALSSLVSIVIMPRNNVMDQFRFWQIGSVGGSTWDEILGFLPALVIGVAVALIMAPSLEVLALGDDAAVGLGARPGLIRMVASAAAVLLCAGVTALAGPIGFVGLMVPHAVRLVWRSASLRTVTLLSAGVGALLLTVSDVIGRVIGGSGEVEVGIVTAVIGAPVFIIIAIRASGASTGVEEAK
ncbi:MAG: iron ABC transporter permease [Coriobacteriia bacterium]|nr:iron ABC transporter permease [Coriobacteriia bacterium]MBS5479324.1 iron ABC transporter permease [Coriobacteriia bacterium]